MSKRKGSKASAAEGMLDDLRAALDRSNDTRAKAEGAGAAVHAALLAIVGAGGSLSEPQIANLQGGAAAAAAAALEQRQKRVKLLSAAHSAQLNVVVRGVALPLVIATTIARTLGAGAERSRLALVSRDWREVVASPEAWPSLVFDHGNKLSMTKLKALLARPRFQLLRALELPHGIGQGATMFKAIFAACPQVVVLGARWMGGSLKAATCERLVEAVPVPGAIRALSLPYGLVEAAPALAAFTGLRALNLVWFAGFTKDAVGRVLGLVGGLAQLERLELTQHFYNASPSMMGYADEAALAPLARGCTKLRVLSLGNIALREVGAWRLLREHAPRLARLKLDFGGLGSGAFGSSWAEAAQIAAELVAMPSLEMLSLTTGHEKWALAGTSRCAFIGRPTVAALVRWAGAQERRKLWLPADVVSAMALNPASSGLVATDLTFDKGVFPIDNKDYRAAHVQTERRSFTWSIDSELRRELRGGAY